MAVTKPSDPWQALHPRYTKPLVLQQLSPHGVDLDSLRSAVGHIPGVPAGTSFRWGGNESVGVPLELPASTTVEQATAYLMHAWALAYQAVVFDSRLPVELAGQWGALTDYQAAFLVWFNVGGLRLVVLPSLSLQGRTIHMSLAHCVLCHQGWMTAHDPAKHGDLVHLSSNYEYLFHQPGSAYHEVFRGYHDNVRCFRYWRRYRTWVDTLLGMVGGRRIGLGEGEIHFSGAEDPGNPIFWSEELMSFFHFKIGERAVPFGSPPGVTYSHLRTVIAQMMSEWRRTFTATEHATLNRPKRFGIEIEYLEEQ